MLNEANVRRLLHGYGTLGVNHGDLMHRDRTIERQRDRKLLDTFHLLRRGTHYLLHVGKPRGLARISLCISITRLKICLTFVRC